MCLGDFVANMGSCQFKVQITKLIKNQMNYLRRRLLPSKLSDLILVPRKSYLVPMKLAIIKYNAGNIQSVSFALERLGVDFSITDNADEIQKADKVIFPGVGEASTTMNYLTKHKSLIR